VLVEFGLMVEDHYPSQCRRAQGGLYGQVQVARGHGEHAGFDFGDDRAQLGDRGVVLQGNRHQAEVGTHQVDGEVVGAGKPNGDHEVTGVDRIGGVQAPGGGDLGHPCPQFAVGDGVERREQTVFHATGGGVGDQFVSALTEGGAVGVAVDESFQYRCEAKARAPRCVEDRGNALRVTELRIGGDEVGDPVALALCAGLLRVRDGRVVLQRATGHRRSIREPLRGQEVRRPPHCLAGYQ
jgi:hypothetical protein